LPTTSNGSSTISEVVVTSAFNIKRAGRSVSSSVQNISSDQLNTVRQVNVDNALAGKVAGIQVQSQSFAKLGAETTVRLRGENGIGVGTGALYVVDGTIIPNSSYINTDDIEDITVLQGPAASALFGPEGANGAIVISNKKARRGYGSYYNYYSDYKLADMEDVDYLQELKKSSSQDVWHTYKDLQQDHLMDVAFYFDAATHFFNLKRTEQAIDIMYNGIEACKNNAQGLRVAAYIFESWKNFDLAIDIYKKLLASSSSLAIQRELALCYFQKGEPQKALDNYYAIITSQDNSYTNSSIKEQALAEMNALIAIYKKELNISNINPALIRKLPVDLRIVVTSNSNTISDFSVIEPGNSTCNYQNPETKIGGHLNRMYLPDDEYYRYSYSFYYKNFPNYYNYWGNYYYNNSSTQEYDIKQGIKGIYRVKLSSYQGYYYSNNIPAYVRIISFKNFASPSQSIEIQNVSLDNQWGTLEIGNVNW
jgi:TonB-dependent SusC/RagA subfamily outer membrane receptor